MQNKSIQITLGIIVVLGVGTLVFWKNRDAAPTQVPVTQTPPSTSSSGVTMSQVAVHNSRTSCWVAINGDVYDLTSWIPKHPGGEQAILQLCGTDGTAKFYAQHGTNAQALATLIGFKIAFLVDAVE